VDVGELVEVKKRILREIDDLKQKLLDKSAAVRYIDQQLSQNCQHEWTLDYIDQLKGFKQCIQITYCPHCELTRQN